MLKKSSWQFLIILLFFALGWVGGQYIFSLQQHDKVALLPLDSRPCNTQYVQVLSKIADIELTLPEDKYLDDFRTPSKEEELWTWLEREAKSSDCLIIYTNQLFQGGLIASRDAKNYADTKKQLIRLENFCRQYNDKEIIVATILPRLKPTQFNAELWQYEAGLTAWAKTAAETLAETGELPDKPENVPAEIVEQYLSLYGHAEMLVEELSDLAEKGCIDRLIIGQDDAEEWSFSNLIYQKIEQKQQNNITTVHGADELTMLILANRIEQTPQPVRIIYTNPQKLDSFYPYEAADLKTIVAVKLAFAGLVENSRAKDVIIIHNDPEKSQYAAELLAAEKGHYVGLADIAYTNRGDYKLKNILFKPEYFDRISCYSGWNTASNTLGTVFAHYRLSQYGGQVYANANAKTQKDILEALVTFKAIRWNEDQIYQAHIAPQLNPLLLEQKLIDGYGVFIKSSKIKSTAQLEQHYASYRQEFAQLINGKHQFYFAEQILPVTVSNFESTLGYPWDRTFEVKVECEFELK